MLPRPTTVVPADGEFTLDTDSVIAVSDATAGVAQWLRSVLSAATGLTFASGPAGAITVSVAADLPPEGYRLRVRTDRVDIIGGGPAGAFYGAQTLRQLLHPDVYRRAPIRSGPWTLPCLDIEDSPRFGWRGCMLDVARHFMPKSDVLRFIDLLALHKLNVLHLHLTDDQGWRVQIRRYPALTGVGAWRSESMVGSRQHERFNGRPHGGYYTQDDIREIVAYAAERFVTVVPEIDMPGHVQAAIAAYPLLGNGGEPVAVSTRWGVSRRVLGVCDEVLDFFRHVLDEVLELFPSQYICIGGDECPKDEWRASPVARERMRALGLPDADALQSWFVRQFDTYLTARGRKLYGWDEILEGGLPAPATVGAWRGMAVARAAVEAGHDVVVCPDTSVYLDYRQSTDPDEPIAVGTPLTLEDVYAFDPLPDGLTPAGREHILGAQCNIWTEHADSVRAVDYLVFPRLCAFAETVWSSAGKDPADFSHRLEGHLRRLDALGVEYRPATGPLPWQRRPDAGGWPRQRSDREAELLELTRNVTGG
jgi:hexosaminidase